MGPWRLAPAVTLLHQPVPLGATELKSDLAPQVSYTDAPLFHPVGWVQVLVAGHAHHLLRLRRHQTGVQL
jgi:hypothetical protein